MDWKILNMLQSQKVHPEQAACMQSKKMHPMTQWNILNKLQSTHCNESGDADAVGIDEDSALTSSGHHSYSANTHSYSANTAYLQSGTYIIISHAVMLIKSKRTVQPSKESQVFCTVSWKASL